MHSLYHKQCRVSIIRYYKLYFKLKLLLIQKMKNFPTVNKNTLKFLPIGRATQCYNDHKIIFTLLKHKISYILQLEKDVG